jgi:hypothetical protein
MSFRVTGHNRDTAYQHTRSIRPVFADKPRQFDSACTFYQLMKECIQFDLIIGHVLYSPFLGRLTIICKKYARQRLSQTSRLCH